MIFTVLGPLHLQRRKKVTMNKFNKKPQKQKFVSLLSSKEHWNGGLPPFTGTRELYESESKLDIDIDDDEWTQEKNENVAIPINNALGALIGAYRSSDESDCDIIVPKDVSKTDDNTNIKTDCKTNKEEENIDTETFEAPEEVKIIKETAANLPPDNIIKTNTEKLPRKRKRCHKNKNKEPEMKMGKLDVKNDDRQKVKKPLVRRRKVTLLERLLEPEIRHERNVILQCIRYVIQNNFFDKSVSACDTKQIEDKHD